MKINGFQRMSDVPEKPVEWLWEGRIPMGELTILEGHPGTNKSSLTDDLAARLTQGIAMPCVQSKSQRGQKGGALLLIGEDSLSKTVRGRLVAAGADLSKVGVLSGVSIPGDILEIEKAVHEVKARLIVVDTLNDYLACNILGNQAVRKALEPLRELAERTNVAVVALRHLVKSSNGHSLLRGGGSVAITAVARSQLKLYKHPDEPDFRVLIQDKSNLGPPSPSLLLEVVPVEGGSFLLEWRGECEFTAADLDGKHKGSPTLVAAEKFLLQKLADGLKEANWLYDHSKGICSKRTLDAAKRNLGIETVRQGKGKDHKVYWTLKDYTPPTQAKPNVESPPPKPTKPKDGDLPEEELDDDFCDMEEDPL